MCKLGGLWKKKGDKHFKCAVCGEELRGWRTWFMVPKVYSRIPIIKETFIKE